MKNYAHAVLIQSRNKENKKNNIFEKLQSIREFVRVCMWRSIFLIRHKVGLTCLIPPCRTGGFTHIASHINTHTCQSLTVTAYAYRYRQAQISSHPHIALIHSVISMNMRVTSVLIVNNDCSHGPSPCCCNAVPLSVIVAAPSITLHSHSHCWTLHIRTHA